MRFLLWIIRAAVFVVLFAFALNNQHDITVHGFFGARWTTPLVMLALFALLMGFGLGVLSMTPSWWRRSQGLAPRRRGSTTSNPDSPAPRIDQTTPGASLRTQTLDAVENRRPMAAEAVSAHADDAAQQMVDAHAATNKKA